MVAYNNIMEQVIVDYDIVQPNASERKFLKRADKPEFIRVDSLKYKNVTFSVEELKTPDVAPLVKIDDINFKALQCWLDNLGPAIYNPVSAIRRTDGSISITPDGAHRLRCLWEIGEPTVRLYVQTVNSGWKLRNDKWNEYKASHVENVYDPSELHYSLNKNIKLRQYYPKIGPIPEILKRFFSSGDGIVVGDKISTPASFKDIMYSTQTGEFRRQIFETIKENADLSGKKMIDIGCNWGYFSFLCWEEGATITGIDVHESMISIMNAIAGMLLFPKENMVNGIVCDLEHFVNVNEDKYDIVLMLNMFHHYIIRYGKEMAWNAMKKILDKCKTVFIMTRNLENVFDGDPVGQFKSNIKNEMKYLYQYGDRHFFMLKGNL